MPLPDVTTAARERLPRANAASTDVQAAVQDIIEDVRVRGESAVLDWSERLDGVRPSTLRVEPQALADALVALDRGVRQALEFAIDRVRRVHESQRRASTTIEVVPGGTVTQRWVPIDRVGLYVPGGQAVYPSSVVMNVVPAQQAGVPSIMVTSPPQRDAQGLPHPTILAACELLGVTEVYAAGGAQAVAMLAFGAGCPPVDMVTGPGNVFVTAAKRALVGRIAIDSEAGPTEIAVLADETADARHVAADLISQAEHDVQAAAVLVTDSAALIDAVQAELVRQVARTKHAERIRAALAGPQSAIAFVDDISAGIAAVDGYAAEHLEIQTRDARAIAMRIRHAGAIFVGPWSPVSLGDYCAGSNHVLPTSGCARHSSALSVQTFLRGVQVIEYDEAALRSSAAAVETLAGAEDLPAHGDAVRVRFDQAF